MEKLKVLIVDDEDSLLEVLSELLSHEYDVHSANNGARALELSRENDFNLVILDFKMPDMLGPDVCRALRTGHLAPEVPVVFLSAQDDRFSRNHAFAAGATDYLTKPFRAVELKAYLRKILAA